MKEQILHLDPHDDYRSARDKMGWAQTQRVLLVWPARGQVLTRRLDLQLVQRHAQRLGARLALITRDGAVSTHARDLGLPVFASVEASRQQSWHQPRAGLAPPPIVAHTRRFPQWTTLRPPPSRIAELARRIPLWLQWGLRGGVFLIPVVALVLLAHAIIPTASILLTPAILPLNLTVEVQADATTEAISGTVIPAHTLRAEVEASSHWPTTGLKDVADAPAVGTVAFTNLAGTPATLPQGLGLRTTSGQAIRFVTTEAAFMEGRIGATVNVAIKAVEAGPAGNVGVGQINAIDGPLGLQLAATNLAATSGGSVVSRFAVTQSDRDQLRAQVATQLQQRALSAIEAQLPPGEFLVLDSVQLGDTLAETYSATPGEVADIITLTLRVAATGWRISESDARAVAQTALLAAVPPNTVLLPDQSRFDRVPQMARDAEGRVHFSMMATGAVMPLIDPTFIQHWIAAQPLATAQQQLAAQLPLATPPQITIAPDWYANWYQRLPWLERHIKVVIQPNIE